MKNILTTMLAVALMCSLATFASAAAEKEDETEVETVFVTEEGKTIHYIGEETVNITEKDGCLFVNGTMLLDLNEESQNMGRMAVPTATWNLANGTKSESGTIPNPIDPNAMLRYYSTYKFKPKASTISLYLSATSMYMKGSDTNMFYVRPILPNGNWNELIAFQGSYITKGWTNSYTVSVPKDGYSYFQYATNVKGVSYTIKFA